MPYSRIDPMVPESRVPVFLTSAWTGLTECNTLVSGIIHGVPWTPFPLHRRSGTRGLRRVLHPPRGTSWFRLDLKPTGKVQEAGSNPACSICVHVRGTCTAKAGGPVSPPTQKTLGRRPDVIRRQTSCKVVLLTRGGFFHFTIIRRGIICSLQLQSSSASSLLSSLL